MNLNMNKYIDTDSLRKEIGHRIDILEDMSIKCAKNDDAEMHAYYHGKAVSLQELLSFIDSFQQEQPSLPDNLDEAAEKSSAQYYKDAGYSPFPNVETAAHKAGFIAGAEYMRKKDVEDMYMSDNRIFLKCYEQGKVDMKEQILKEAVEGEIQMRYSGCLCAKTIRAINEDKFKLGDKVRIIIVKEEK